MRTFKASDAAKLIGAELAGNPDAAFTGMTYDSRTVKLGNLFVAVKGEKADGRDFVESAFNSGAAAVLSSGKFDPPEDKAMLITPSPEEAVRKLAAFARKEFKGVVIGVVGSVGKTTTKDFSSKFLSLMGATYATRGNLNNLLGLPEMILNADEYAKHWVLEMGISKPGEMDLLAPTASPNVVLFTAIKPVHTEFFPSVAAIRDEKAKVLNYLKAPSFYIYNADDELLSELPSIFKNRTFSYGISPTADLRISQIGELGEKGFIVKLSYNEKEAAVALPFLSRVQCFNFAAALMLALSLGAPLTAASEVLPMLSPAAHRGVPHYLKNNILLYDDSYNSNPGALSLLIRSAATWNRNLVGVFGEMRELGAESEKYHREIGELAGENLSSLLCVGNNGAKVLSLSFSGSRKPCFYADCWEDGYRWLKGRIIENDAVIVKGSRAICLDKLVEKLIADYSGEGAE
jgi:UDP-N-acetylmuramoyl-tripeptide--D-alanyl-D-alanine ligase